MWYLYLDESGDLGFDFFGKKPSKFFTVYILVVREIEHNRALIKAVKKTIRRKPPSRANAEHKGSHTTLDIKRYFYQLVEPIPFDLYGVLPRFCGHLTEGPEWARRGVMGARRTCSAEYKREAVARLDAPGVTGSPIAAELGIGANGLGRWRRELRRQPQQAVGGNGRSRDEELAVLRRELARVTKERDCLREAAAFFARASRCSIG